MDTEPKVKYLSSRIPYTHGQKIVIFEWKERDGRDLMAMAIPLS